MPYDVFMEEQSIPIVRDFGVRRDRRRETREDQIGRPWKLRRWREVVAEPVVPRGV
jgi:hypothetical protein